MKAAADITHGVNGKQKIIKGEDEKSPRGTPLSKNNWGKMGSVHTPTFVLRETGRNPGPRGMNSRIIPPPPYQTEKGWYCDNCQTSHGGPICPCLICNGVGHIYYLCPHRDEKESRRVVPDRNWMPPMRVCEICGTEHAGPCTLGQKQNPQIQAMLATKPPREWPNNNSLERSNIKTRGATPYCMHCGYKDNLHDPNCLIVREKAMYFQCSFCRDVGHPSDNCAARLQVLQEQQKGYICSYCGVVDHTSENCSVLRENIASDKADINRRNMERYEASKQNTAKGQEGAYRAQQGRTNNSGQSKQVPKPMTSSGGPHPHSRGMGGTGGGGQSPKKPNGDKNLPPDKIEQEEEEQEGEDADRTITVSESTSGEGMKIVKGDGTELSLKQLLKLIGKSKRRRKRRTCKRGKGGGGGDSPSSSGGSEEGSDESDLEIRGIGGKRGHRGTERQDRTTGTCGASHTYSNASSSASTYDSTSKRC